MTLYLLEKQYNIGSRVHIGIYSTRELADGVAASVLAEYPNSTRPYMVITEFELDKEVY